LANIINQSGNNSCWLVKGFEAIAYSNSVVEVIPIHTVIQGERQAGKPNEL